jgi:hypothetical protein
LQTTEQVPSTKVRLLIFGFNDYINAEVNQYTEGECIRLSKCCTVAIAAVEGASALNHPKPEMIKALYV